MRNIIATQRQLRRTLISLVILGVAAAALGLAWPAAAHDFDPGSRHVVGYTSPDAQASPWSPIEPGRRATARGLLAQRLGVSADSLKFVNDQAVNWPDTSLGCPKPGYAYAKVIVPGYRITFAYDGANYEVHTAAKSGFGQYLPPVSCEAGLSHDRVTDDPTS